MENAVNTFIYSLLPLLAGLVIFLGLFKNNVVLIRRFAKYFSLLFFALSVYIFFFKSSNFELDHVFLSTFYPISPFSGGYITGFDTPGSLFAALISLIVLICFVCAKSSITKKQKIFYPFVLFLESSALVLISAGDFYVFCAAALFEVLCVYILANIFMPQKTARQGTKEYLILNSFFIFLLTGAFSLIFALLRHNGIDANIPNFIHNCRDISSSILFIVFIPLLGLSMIKLPFFPLHRPLLGIIENSNASFACVFLTEFILGFYIFIKFNLYALAPVFQVFAPIIAIFAIFNVIYFSILAFGQIDLKKSLGYFAFSQSSTAICAACSLSIQGIEGAIFQCFSQSLILLGLFLCFCFASKIFKTTKLPFMGALATHCPKLAALCFILTLAALAMPFTSGFCARFLCLCGGFSTEIYSQNIIWICTILILIGLIPGMFYLIKVYQNIFFGTDECEKCKPHDLLRHNTVALLIIVGCVCALGIAPCILSDAVSKYADMVISMFLF